MKNTEKKKKTGLIGENSKFTTLELPQIIEPNAATSRIIDR
jgi:hypothetical protein